MLGLLVLTTVVLCWAYTHRSENLLIPGKGTGYALGITGAVMMLVLLAYPMRKRIRFMRTWGAASSWFRWHMILGVVGPALIILHSNYSLHSANATVAFLSMLTVAGSGLAGRYLYGRIHRGLYGQKLEARGLREEADRSRSDLASSWDAQWLEGLQDFEKAALAPTPTLGSAFVRAFRIDSMIGRSRRSVVARMAADLERQARLQGWSARDFEARKAEEVRRLRGYYAAVRKAATLGVYERLFSLWHVLHVPLFIILVLTAIIHVVAVHLY